MNDQPPPEKPKPRELEKALKRDIGYVIQQTVIAFPQFQGTVIPVLKKNGLREEIGILNNASLESQLLFLRKLNEFFMHLPENEPNKQKRKKLKDDDLRAEHYAGFTSPGAFLSEDDEIELHRRVGHITLTEVRKKKKNWEEFLNLYMPIAVHSMIDFCRFCRDKYQQPLSHSTKRKVKDYVQTLERFAIRWPMPAGS